MQFDTFAAFFNRSIHLRFGRFSRRMIRNGVQIQYGRKIIFVGLTNSLFTFSKRDGTIVIDIVFGLCLVKTT